MEPTNGKTARKHVLPGAMREQRGCGGYVGFDEILLSPDRLSRVLYNNDIVVNHLNTYQQETQNRTSDEDSKRGKMLRVLPAADLENILKSNNSDSDREAGEEQPPVKLVQKVTSEDLSWLDTIIDTAASTATTPSTQTTVKQQRGDHSVRSDKKSK